MPYRVPLNHAIALFFFLEGKIFLAIDAELIAMWERAFFSQCRAGALLFSSGQLTPQCHSEQFNATSSKNKKPSDARPGNQAEQDVGKRLILNLPVSLLYQNRWRNQSRKGAGYYQTKISKKGARKHLKNTNFLA